jgi:hypothetical protein
MNTWNEILRLQPKRFTNPTEIFLRLNDECKKSPQREWPITDFAELVNLARVIQEEESGPDPIPFAVHGGRDPGPEDLDDGKCWCYENLYGDGVWVFGEPARVYWAQRWLPASVRYLPARVEL